MVKVIRKVLNKEGRVLGIVCEDSSGRFFVPKADLMKYVYSNVKISSDYRVLGFVHKEIVEEKVLYHGSKSGLSGKIECLSRSACDFGKAFYLGDMRSQAEELCAEGSSPVIYEVSLITEGLSIYEFKNDIDWAMYVGYNRGYLTKGEYAKLDKMAEYISSHDIVYGLIADDRIADAFQRFIGGYIGDRCLVECLKMVNYGNQYALKSQKACDRVQIMRYKNLYGSERASIVERKRRTIIDIKRRMELVVNRYKTEGKFIERLLDERYR